MIMLPSMCPYHTPCGLCTKFDKPCKEVCDSKKQKKINN